MDLIIVDILKGVTKGLHSTQLACKLIAAGGLALAATIFVQDCVIGNLERRTSALETKLNHILEPVYEEEK